MGGPGTGGGGGGLWEAMSAAVHEAHEMTGFEALKGLYLLLGGGSVGAAKGVGVGKGGAATFSAGHNAAIKGHLPSALVELLLAGAGVQISVSGQAPTLTKKQSNPSTPASPALTAVPPSATARDAAVKPSSALSDCEFQCFTLLALLCSHDHTAIEELVAAHKVDPLLHLATVVGPSSYTSIPLSSVFHSNLVKLLKVISKGQKIVKGVPRAMHETNAIASLLGQLKPPALSSTTSSSSSPSLLSSAVEGSAGEGGGAVSRFQLAFDSFDLLTTFLIDSFPHAQLLLDDFEGHDGYAAVLSHIVGYERQVTQGQYVRTVARRLIALITIGYEKLDGEQDVLPFNLPPSSRISAAHSLTASQPSASTSPASFASPSGGKMPLSTVLSVQPSLPETHSHAIGALPSTPSIARIRGHARNSSSTSLSPRAVLPSASSTGPAPRLSSASSVRNLDAVQLVRDVFLQCSASSLRLHLLSSLEWVFTSATQLHLISSTNFTSRLLQSLHSFSTPVQNALLQSLQLIVTHTHNDFIPFKELCALNVTLTSDLTRTSLPSILSVIISLDSMLDYDQLRYQHLLREAGVLDVMITNINSYYALFAPAYEARYDPMTRTHQQEGGAAGMRGGGGGSPMSPFSPKASTLSNIRLEVKKKREAMTPSGSPVSAVRRRLDVERKDDDADHSPQPSPSSAPHPSPRSSMSAHDTSSLSVTQLVRVVTAALDVLTILLRDNSHNQELFSTTTGPAVLLSFTVYPPLATPALHLVELLLQSHYARLEAMMAPPLSSQGARGQREEKQSQSRWPAPSPSRA